MHLATQEATRETRARSTSSTLRSNNRRPEYNDARAPSLKLLTRLNVYETIDSGTVRANDKSNSKSLDRQPSLPARRIDLKDQRDQENDDDELHQPLLLTGNQHQLSSCTQDDEEEEEEELRRRHPNANKPAITQHDNPTSEPSNHNNTANLYSEIQPLTSSTVPTQLPKMNCTTQDYYQTPAYATVHRSPPSPTILDDELGQLIETKRKRTLLLLKAKEAPRASFEQTSPSDETAPPESLSDMPKRPGEVTPPQDHGEHYQSDSRPISPMSDYENLVLVDNRPDSCPIELRAVPDRISGVSQVNDSSGDERHPTNVTNMELDHGANNDDNHQQQQPSGSPIVSPSESQNFNTLSIVSDTFGDSSQEESLLVNQLSRG